MTKSENYPQPSPNLFIERNVLVGSRKNDIDTAKPKETLLIIEKRWMGKGLRKTGTKALFLVSYVPLLLTAEAAADSGGSLVFIVCCVITLYLFGLTGWTNDKID